jgi:hypothetical protein
MVLNVDGDEYPVTYGFYEEEKKMAALASREYITPH